MAKRTPIYEDWDDFSKGYDKLSKETIKGLRKELTPRSNVEKTTAKVLRDVGFVAEVTTGTMDGVVSGVVAGGVAIKNEVGFRNWWLNKHWDNQALTLSQTIAKQGWVEIIAGEINKGFAQAKTWVEIAEDVNKTTFIEGNLPKHLKELDRAAKNALSGDKKALAQYRKAVKKSVKQVNRLAKGGAPTDRLKQAYTGVITATEKGSVKAINNAIVRAVDEKARYNAQRISRAESARAYAQGIVTNADEDEDITAIQWVLGTRHNVIDICDFNAGANLYGMGPGVYPKDRVPAHPAHPHCIPEGEKVTVPGKVLTAYKGFYNGPGVKIILRNGSKFTVTPNHPIMTNLGWVSANKVNIFHKVVYCPDPKRVSSLIFPDNKHVNTKIEDVFSSFKESLSMDSVTMPSSTENFHSDGRFFNKDISVVGSNAFLGNSLNASGFTEIAKKAFRLRSAYTFLFSCFRDFAFHFFGSLRSPNRLICFLSNLLPFFKVGFASIISLIRFGSIADRHLMLSELLSDDGTTDTKLFREFLYRFSSDISFEDIIEVRNIKLSTHVYDLHCSPYEVYICNGAVVKNCGCSLIPRSLRGPKAFNADAGKEYLQRQSKKRQQHMLGVADQKKFQRKPNDWKKLLNQYNPDGPRPQIPSKFLQ